MDWALRADNSIPYTILIRNGAKGRYPKVDPRGLLKIYIAQISHDYICASWESGIEASIQRQFFEGNAIFFDRQDPDFGLSRGEREELKYLLDCCGLSSREEFRNLVGQT